MSTQETLTTDLTSLYDEVADFFASSPTPEQIVAYHLSDRSDRLISALLEANRMRELTPAEALALDEYTRIERLTQAIKVRTIARLRKTAS